MTPKQFLAALKRLGWSQVRAARELHTTQPAVSRWASGKRPVPGPVATALQWRIALESCRKKLGESAD